jgi:peptide/nickel transport system substrate-binding protein
VDIATDLLFSQIKEIEKDPKLKYNLFAEARRGTAGNIWFNVRRWPVNQLKCRQAIAMGADWRKIPTILLPKGVLPVRYSFFERTWLENTEAKNLAPSYNPEKARQLLKEVEKEAGKPLPRIYFMTDKGRQGIPGATIQIAAEQFKKIGLNMDIAILDPEVSKDKQRRDPKSDWDLMLAPVKGPAIDPGDTISDFYSKTPAGGDGKNIPGYDNPKVDELYVKGGAAYNRQEAKKIYQEIEKIILKDLVAMPIFDLPFIFAYNKRVHDFPAHDSAHLLFRTSWNNVWLDKK